MARVSIADETVRIFAYNHDAIQMAAEFHGVTAADIKNIIRNEIKVMRHKTNDIKRIKLDYTDIQSGVHFYTDIKYKS